VPISLRRVIPPQAIEYLSLATRTIATFVTGEKYFTEKRVRKKEKNDIGKLTCERKPNGTPPRVTEIGENALFESVVDGFCVEWVGRVYCSDEFDEKPAILSHAQCCVWCLKKEKKP